MCETHYYRLRRTGTTDLRALNCEYLREDGYVLIKDAKHPLAMASGWVAEHRAVAYNKYGSGSQQCHWCGSSMDWTDVAVDHLNEVKADNSPDNLVVACHPCNRARGAMKPFIRSLTEDRVAAFIQSIAFMRAA